MDGERRANKLHPTCRNNGDGMYAEETRGNTESPSGDRGKDQLATRERQAGPCGVAERFVVPMKPGNSGGGKGTQLKTNVTSDKGPRDWDEPNNSIQCSEVADGVARQSEGIAQPSFSRAIRQGVSGKTFWPYAVGLMLWFMRQKFDGSYLFFRLWISCLVFVVL